MSIRVLDVDKLLKSQPCSVFSVAIPRVQFREVAFVWPGQVSIGRMKRNSAQALYLSRGECLHSTGSVTEHQRSNRMKPSSP